MAVEQATAPTAVDTDRALRLLRVALGGSLLFLVWSNQPWRYAGLPESFIRAPGWGGSLLTALPINPLVAAMASAALAAAAVALIAGWRVRAAAVVAALSGWYALGVPQLYGKVDHYHLVIWLAALLALGLSPAVTMRVATFLIGCVYLFPGLAKLLEGPAWWWSEHLHTIALHERSVLGWNGPLFPAWMAPGLAVATIAFEVFVIVGLLSRWRRWAILAALGFHLGVGLTIGIWFWTVPVFFPALWFAEPIKVPDWAAVRVLPLVGLVFASGLMFVDRAWPFAAYPTFTGVFAFDPDVKTLVDADGERLVDRWSWMNSGRAAGLEYMIWLEPWRIDEPFEVVSLSELDD